MLFPMVFCKKCCGFFLLLEFYKEQCFINFLLKSSVLVHFLCIIKPRKYLNLSYNKLLKCFDNIFTKNEKQILLKTVLCYHFKKYTTPIKYFGL